MTQLVYTLNEYQKKIIDRELNDIQEVQQHLLNTIVEQDSKLNSIEENMSSIRENMVEGTSNLEIANKHYYSWTPIVVGGTIGGIMMLPSIALIGLKAGSMASITGSIIGFLSGYKIQLM